MSRVVGAVVKSRVGLSAARCRLLKRFLDNDNANLAAGKNYERLI